MKIIICSNFYPPNFQGGAELIAHYQAIILKKMGHNVIIFAGKLAYSKRYQLKHETYDDFTIYRINLYPKDFQVTNVNFSHRKVEEHFDQILESFKPDIVHMHNIIGLSLGIIHLAKLRKIKTVLTVHDHWGFCSKAILLKADDVICNDFNNCIQCAPVINAEQVRGIIPSRLRNDFFTIQLNKIDAIISPSHYLAEAYISSGFPREKVRTIWNGINIKRFEQIAKIPFNGTIRFTFIGFLGKHKGIDILIKSLSFIGNEKSRVKINIVGFGDPIILGDLKRQVNTSGVSELVRFWGKVDINHVEKVYKETDVLILPSIWPENQPVTITEAMACHTPVIGSDIGGIPELVEVGKTGYLFEPGNAEDLASKMLQFIKEPDKIKAFGENAYNKIMNNTFENQVKKIVQVYNSKTTIQVKQLKKTLIVCSGNRFLPKSAQALENFLKSTNQDNYHFVMSSWIGKDQFQKAALLWVVDNKEWQDDVNYAMENNILLLVPQKIAKLKKLCLSKNCGLYYKDVLEAEECLRYILLKN